MNRPGRLRLAHLPTPLQCVPALGSALGIDLWVKRDDMTGGPEAGNKIRKLEFLFAEALDRGCDTVITCGGIQSNHARATALVAARLGLSSVLMLRDPELQDDEDGSGVPLEPHMPAGNLILDCMAGARVLRITRQSYRRRHELMNAEAARLQERGHRVYVIPEGGSNGLGSMGYVEAMAEVRRQLDEAGDPSFDRIVVACGSGGTAAGIALGAAQFDVADKVCAMAVCDDEPTFERSIAMIIEEARSLDPSLGSAAPWSVDASSKGPAYAVSTPEQRARICEVARRSGLILDPVYTGKAFDALWRHCASGRWREQRVLFLHTGGLPGLLAQQDVLRPHLELIT